MQHAPWKYVNHAAIILFVSLYLVLFVFESRDEILFRGVDL
jgi:hypothetical protein